jgi:hypothetical protein
MANDKMMAIIIKALAKTKEQKISWETGPTTNSYYCHIGENAISIGEKGNDYTLKIYNQDGDVIEAATDPELKNIGYEDAYSSMKELHQLAKSSALGIDVVMDDILKVLGDD